MARIIAQKSPLRRVGSIAGLDESPPYCLCLVQTVSEDSGFWSERQRVKSAVILSHYTNWTLNKTDVLRVTPYRLIVNT